MPGKKKKNVSSKTLKFDQTIVTTAPEPGYFSEMEARYEPVKKTATRRKAMNPPKSMWDTLPGDAPRPPPMPNAAKECPDPDCRQCADQRRREMEQLPKYYTGLRVSVSGLGPRRKIGTVINVPSSERLRGSIAVCLDEPVGPDYSARELDEMCKPGFGIMVSEKIVRILEDQCSYEAFAGVPKHIGVVVAEGDRHDSVNFKNGQTGRIITQPSGPTSNVLVSWTFPNKHFFEGSRNTRGVPPGEHPSCYNVPRSMLAFCRMDNRGRPVVIWPNTNNIDDVDFKKGDYLKVAVAEPQRISNGVRNFRLSSGTIVKYQGTVDRYKSNVTLAGGCDPAIIGVSAIVATRGLEKLGDPFIDAGEEVEIKATLDFRKRDLKGLRAVVILPLDQDGEIGLQFAEDIGAGSLDGHGQDKRCLYIHHSLVKKASG